MRSHGCFVRNDEDLLSQVEKLGVRFEQLLTKELLCQAGIDSCGPKHLIWIEGDDRHRRSQIWSRRQSLSNKASPWLLEDRLDGPQMSYFMALHRSLISRSLTALKAGVVMIIVQIESSVGQVVDADVGTLGRKRRLLRSKSRLRDLGILDRMELTTKRNPTSSERSGTGNRRVPDTCL